MVSDHVAVTPDVAEQYPAPFYEPFTTLSWLAGVTERVRLGTTVLIVPYRHPLLVARMAANLNELSGGRFVLGVGVGWARQEFEALGVPFDRRGQADRRVDHGVRARCGGTTGYRAGAHPDLGRRATATARCGARSGSATRGIRCGRHPAGWQESLARLRTLAARRGAFAARRSRRASLLRLTDAPVGRPAWPGEGTIEQVVGDLERLRADGARAVVLDPFFGDPEETRPPEVAWHALATVRQARIRKESR